MKQMFTYLILSLIAISAHAQWSNMTNQFYDSLDMPVAQAANDQKNAIIVKSESDGGYFVIWEDYRNAVNSADIYAQKYDKDGNRLWAVNGIPVATGATDQRYSFINNSSLNFRNYSHAAAEGAGGFYIAWRDYVSSYSRVSVQHVLSTGTPVFGDIGFVVGDPIKVTGKNYVSPQLIADGLNGFFIGYGEILSQQSNMLVYVYDYKDENGTLKQNGGGIMNAYLGVAENSALWVPETFVRVLPFIGQHFVLLIQASSLVHNMHEAYDRLGFGHDGFAAFIAGPSKTADIEQSLVLGAHGPRSLGIYLLK